MIDTLECGVIVMRVEAVVHGEQTCARYCPDLVFGSVNEVPDLFGNAPPLDF